MSCASSNYVGEQIGPIADRVTQVETKAGQNEGQITMLDKRINEIDAGIDKTMPQFPWPPPQWTSRCWIDRSLLLNTKASVSIGEVFDCLKDIVIQAKYPEWSVYAIGKGGFAIICRLETIESDGQAKPEPDRWSTLSPAMKTFTLRSYLHALFFANPGYYRVIVLVVTSLPIVPGTDAIDEFTMKDLLSKGQNDLPEPIRSKPFDSEIKTAALIYEFKRSNMNEEPKRVEQSDITPQKHLIGAGLWKEGQK